MADRGQPPGTSAVMLRRPAATTVRCIGGKSGRSVRRLIDSFARPFGGLPADPGRSPPGTPGHYAPPASRAPPAPSDVAVSEFYASDTAGRLGFHPESRQVEGGGVWLGISFLLHLKYISFVFKQKEQEK